MVFLVARSINVYVLKIHCAHIIPYSGKFLREKIFMVFTDQGKATKILPTKICLTYNMQYGKDNHSRLEIAELGQFTKNLPLEKLQCIVPRVYKKGKRVSYDSALPCANTL